MARLHDALGGRSYRGTRGQADPVAARGRRLSRDDERRRRRRHRARRRRPAALALAPPPTRASPPLARRRLLPDDDALPPRRRRAGDRSVERRPRTQRRLRERVQPASRAARPPLRSTLLVLGRRGRGIPREHDPLRAPEPRPGRPLPPPERVAMERVRALKSRLTEHVFDPIRLVTLGRLWPRTNWSYTAPASTTSRTSLSGSRATAWSASPASRARESRVSRSTRSTPRASAATSRA